MVSEVIIVGGGASIKPYIPLLQPLCATKFTILTNYSYNHFTGTFLAFNDRDFYKPRPDKDNPDIYEELKKLPLLVGINDCGIEEFKLDNTILLDKKYSEYLTGFFAINLAEKLINKGIIYLLGFDWNRRDPKTIVTGKGYNPKSDQDLHYYGKSIVHRGTGLFGYYENHNPDKEFAEFIKEDIKIYNVSLDSNINCFEKISYEQMFNLLNKEIYNQEILREEIRRKLCTL